MSEDSSSSDAYFEMFVSEYDKANFPQYDKNVDYTGNLKSFQDIEVMIQNENRKLEKEIQLLQDHKESPSYEFNSLYSREFPKPEINNQNLPPSSGTPVKSMIKTNIILTKTIPWSISQGKSDDVKPNKQNQNDVTKPATLLYAIKTEFLLCSICINHDGSIFAYSDGNKVYFVSLQNGTNIYSVSLPPDNREIQTRALCFSKDSKYLAASICQGKIAIISDKSVLTVLSKHTNIVSSLAFTDDYLISGGFDGSLVVWKMLRDDNHFVQTLKSNNYAQGQMSSSSSTSSAASSSTSNSTFSLYKEIHFQSVISIDACQTNSFVAIGFLNSTVGFFDSKCILGDTEKDLENEKDDFSSSSSNSANQTNEVRINSTHSLDTLDTIIGHYSDSSLSSPDSSDTPSLDSNQKEHYSNKPRNPSNPTEIGIHSKMKATDSKIKFFEVHQTPLLNVAFSPNNNLIATCSKDRTAKIWNISELVNGNIENGNSNFDSPIMIQTSTPELLNSLEGHTDFVTAASFSPIDNIIFTGSKDETIKAWNTQTGELLFTLNAHQNTVFSIKHHPTKKIFVSCSGDGLICVWNYMSTD